MASRSFKIATEVDSRAVTAGLKAVDREINRDVRRTIGEAAQKVTLPVVKRAAPHGTGSSMTTRSTYKGAYVTTNARGKRRAIVAITNWGGTIRAPIVPKKKKALHWGNVYTAKVTKPRRIRGTHWIDKSIRFAMPLFTDQVGRDLIRIMRSRIAYARTFR